MRILLFTHDFYPNIGGVANVMLNLYNNFKDKPDTLFIINPFSKGENLFDILINEDVNLRDFAYLLRKRKFYFFTLFSFWKILQSKKIALSHRIKLIIYYFTKPKLFIKVIKNVIQLHPFLKKLEFDIVVAGHSGWILQLCFIISKIFNRKLVAIAYGLEFLVKYALSFRTYYFRNTDKIILITNQTRKLIQKIHHLSDEQLEVIHVGLDVKNLNVTGTKKDLRKEFNISDETFVILSVGRHVTRKNFQLAIKAVDEIKKMNPEMKIIYYLIGEGEQTDNLKKLTKNLKLEKIINFLGSCDELTRNKYYKLSDLFIMPSITKKNDIEGFGIVFLEANYFKVPCIGSAAGGIVEAIVDKETGYLIKPNDLDELVEKILYLANNKSLRKEMGENGYKRVLEEFQWKNIVDDYIGLFKRVLNE